MSDKLFGAILSLSERLHEELASRSPGSVLVVDPENGHCAPAGDDGLARLAEPRNLPPDRIFAFARSGELCARVPVRYGFGLNWVGEAAPGKLEGRLGLPVDPGAWVNARVCLAGPFLYAVWREDDDRVRVRLARNRSKETGCPVRVRVEADPGVAFDDGELAAALAGLHPMEAFERLLDNATRGRFDERYARLFEFWRSLDRLAAEAIWRACDDERLAELREWIRRIAEMETAEELADDLAWAPPRHGWPAEAWIEALGGALLEAALDPATFRRIREAARLAWRILGEEGSADLLAGLKRKAVEENVHPVEGGVPERMREFLEPLRSRALEALEKQLAAELAWRWQAGTKEAAWFDGSFDFSPEGLGAYREVLCGELRRALDPAATGVRRHVAVLTHGLRRRTVIELHLPFLDRRQWPSRLETLVRAYLESTQDGRVLVYACEADHERAREDLARNAMNLCGAFVQRPESGDTGFELCWRHRRCMNAVQARLELVPLLLAYGFDEGVQWLEPLLPEAEQIEMEMSLSVPGTMAAAWLQAPIERSSDFRPVYTEVSVAVQQALRTWLPFVYFRDLARYETPAVAYPLIVYRCTLPYRSKASSEFAYDIMSAESVALARRSTGMALAAELARIEQLLLAAGKPETARFYRPSRRDVVLASVERSPRLFHSLLVADADFIDHLVRLGVRAGGLRRAMQHEPQRAVRELVRFCEESVKTFHRRLRRLYGGEDFTAFGPLILIEATRGLNAGLRSAAALRGVVRLAACLKGGEARESIFVNRDYGATLRAAA